MNGFLEGRRNYNKLYDVAIGAVEVIAQDGFRKPSLFRQLNRLPKPCCYLQLWQAWFISSWGMQNMVKRLRLKFCDENHGSVFLRTSGGGEGGNL